MSSKMGDAQIFQKMQKISFFEETVSKKSGPLAPRGPKLYKTIYTKRYKLFISSINLLYETLLYFGNTRGTK